MRQPTENAAKAVRNDNVLRNLDNILQHPYI